MNALYLLGSLAGVGVLVALNVVLLGRARRRVDADAAVALLAAENPGFRAARSLVAAGGEAALVEDGDGVLYVVASAGDRLVSRKLARGGVRAVARAGASLVLRFRDLTFPRLCLTLGSEAEARDWEARIAALSS